MINSLSILIPAHNQPCLQLVETLATQALDINGLSWELFVADDGSTNTKAIQSNLPINKIRHCHYIVRKQNVGRAAIRNYLARMARHDWLLFIDSDVVIDHANYLRTYTDIPDNSQTVYGGVHMGGCPKKLQGNLRYKYEKTYETSHPALVRQRSPYNAFRTTNFAIRRELILVHPFDESIRTYGYEDVLFGKALHDQRISILHIDNPVTYETYEDNTDFLQKTDEALHTLHTLQTQLADYSPLLLTLDRLKRIKILWLLKVFFHIFKYRWKRNLLGRNPSLWVYKLYKAGRFTTI